MALKLAAYLLFWDQDPAVDPGANHPALLGQEFVPDLLAVNDAGEASVWVECGKTTVNKISKVTRRFRRARLVVFKATEREALQMREVLQGELEDKAGLIDILAWPAGSFREWHGALADKVEVYGEAGGLSINLTVNEHPLALDFKRF